MSSDDVELFAFDKYDVSASKRTIVRVFPTISTPHLIPNMSTMRMFGFLTDFNISPRNSKQTRGDRKTFDWISNSPILILYRFKTLMTTNINPT